MNESELNETVEGRKFDGLVAKKLGWEYKITVPGHAMSLAWIRDGWVNGQEVPPYSTSIEAAFEIVEYLKENGFDPILAAPPDGLKTWSFSFYDKNDKTISVRADTAPLAICLAFLKLP